MIVAVLQSWLQVRSLVLLAGQFPAASVWLSHETSFNIPEAQHKTFRTKARCLRLSGSMDQTGSGNHQTQQNFDRMLEYLHKLVLWGGFRLETTNQIIDEEWSDFVEKMESCDSERYI